MQSTSQSSVEARARMHPPGAHTESASASTGVIRRHWPEYLMEAWGLGLFMVSACAFTVLIEHPASPVRQTVEDATLRRAMTGVAMGLTLIAIVYSPWGKQSGAHINPAMTLTFFRLGMADRRDAAFYAAAQSAGAVLGTALAFAMAGATLGHPSVNFAATVPGPTGVAVAFSAEVAISFGMMLLVLTFTNHARLARFTGIAAAVLVAAYITLEAPLSGMSMNPARTLGSALFAGQWTALWVYLTAPLLGFLLAAEAFTRVRGRRGIGCAKYHHLNSRRCIFCEYQQRESLHHDESQEATRV